MLYIDAAYYFNLVTASPSSYSFDNANASKPVCTAIDAGPGIGIGAGQLNSALCTPSTLLAGVLAHPTASFAGLVMTATASVIMANALVMQPGAHPAHDRPPRHE